MTSQQSAASMVERAVIEIIGKARQSEAQQQRTIREATINIGFSGGGTALPVSGLPGILKIPFNCIVVGAQMYAGDENLAAVAVTASVDLQLSSIVSFPGTSPVYTTIPTLSAASFAELDVSDWTQNYVKGDVLLYRLAAFTGTATWLALLIDIRGTLAEEGSASIIDDTGDFVVDDNGNLVVIRN